MSQDSPQRRLKINLADLVEAFESGFDETTYYLDLETGRILSVDEETRHRLERVTEEEGDDRAPGDIAEGIDPADLPDWQEDELQVVAAIEAGYGTRYIEIPRVESREAYDDMVDFISTVRGRHLREKLEVAIDGPGAFRRFKAVLGGDPKERERWFAFKDDRMQERARDWLESQDIVPV